MPSLQKYVKKKIFLNKINIFLFVVEELGMSKESIDIKIAVLGDGWVGKSTITVRYVQDLWLEDYDPTIEDNYRKQIKIDKNICFLEILDYVYNDEYTNYIKTS